MSRSKQYKTNFTAGVISPEAESRIDSANYNNGLSVGKNIIIQTTGGATRRPGSEFIRDYGDLDYVRLFPFMFNTDQKYIIVTYFDGVECKFDVYKDNVEVTLGVVMPYKSAEELESLDFAQSADVMVLTHGSYPPQMIVREGSSDTWDIREVPLINVPCESLICVNENDPTDTQPPTCADGSIPYCTTGKCVDGSDPTCPDGYVLEEVPVWSDENGYPKHCTFHQGRLWFAGSYNYPQSVWGSKTQDFFNFDIGVADPSDAISETIDTDFINPITNIYSAGKLVLFTTGGEFVNGSSLITPMTSSWSRQTTYGSSDRVRPIVVDSSILYLDSTERIIRTFVYVDDTKGYESPSISSEAEHLINMPINMGVMRGDIKETSNFVYVVNSDGTMAVLNFSKMYRINAWTQWTTQGSYKQVLDLDRELYVLVTRSVNTDLGVQKHWMLERLDKGRLTDSGNVVESLTQSTLQDYGKDNQNFFGVYYESNSEKGKVVIVRNGNVVYKIDTLKDKPLESYLGYGDILYKAGSVFSTDEDVRSIYFDEECGYRWYMYDLYAIHMLNDAKNYIDGLTHLLGQKVVANLDGNVFKDVLVVPGDQEDTLEYTYPDGSSWLYDNQNFIIKSYFENGTTFYDAVYNNTLYEKIPLTPYGLLISGEEGQDASEYLEIGELMEKSPRITSPHVINASGIIVAGRDIPLSVSTYTLITAAGGGGASSSHNTPEVGTGGEAGEYVENVDITYSANYSIDITFGVGGETDQQGGDTIYGTETLLGGAPGTLYVGQIPCECETHCPGDTCFCYAGFDGESNPISNGGTAGCAAPGGEGSKGSGGAGGGLMNYYDDFGNEHYIHHPGGKGGDGVMQVEWSEGEYYSERHKIRKMVLAKTTVTSGVVIFPNDPFTVGEAGLFFDVAMVTLPINANAGAGSLINEPKRVVSCTVKFVDTAGVEVNGYMIPERYFGEEVLDKAPPVLTGINKIRFLGYNRDTRIYINQDEPLPMTITSLDIEVNY